MKIKQKFPPFIIKIKKIFLNERMVEKARKAIEIKKNQRIRQLKKKRKSPFNINKKRTKKKAKEKVFKK